MVVKEGETFPVFGVECTYLVVGGGPTFLSALGEDGFVCSPNQIQFWLLKLPHDSLLHFP